jgi:hypothetical protein
MGDRSDTGAVVSSSPRRADAAALPGRIVFVRSSRIWSMDASGANQVQLTIDGSEPKLSPGVHRDRAT